VAAWLDRGDGLEMTALQMVVSLAIGYFTDCVKWGIGITLRLSTRYLGLTVKRFSPSGVFSSNADRKERAVFQARNLGKTRGNTC